MTICDKAMWLAVAFEVLISSPVLWTRLIRMTVDSRLIEAKEQA
jgi:hypothetical protein